MMQQFLLGLAILAGFANAGGACPENAPFPYAYHGSPGDWCCPVKALNAYGCPGAAEKCPKPPCTMNQARCPRVSMDGRCGPKYQDAVCSTKYRSWAVYCNEDNGWCGKTTAHRDAQVSDKFDESQIPIRCDGHLESPISLAVTAASENEHDISMLYEEGVKKCGDSCKDDAQNCLGDDTDMDFSKMIACYNAHDVSAACTTCIESLIGGDQAITDQMVASQGTVANSTSPVIPVLATMLAAATLLLVFVVCTICKEMQHAVAPRSYKDKLHLVDGSTGPASTAYDTTPVTLNP